MISKANQIDNIATQSEMMFAPIGDLAAPLRDLRWAAFNYDLLQMGASLEEIVTVLGTRSPLFIRGLLGEAARRLGLGDVRGAELHVEEARRYVANLYAEV